MYRIKIVNMSKKIERFPDMFLAVVSTMEKLYSDKSFSSVKAAQKGLINIHNELVEKYKYLLLELYITLDLEHNELVFSSAEKYGDLLKIAIAPACMDVVYDEENIEFQSVVIEDEGNIFELLIPLLINIDGIEYNVMTIMIQNNLDLYAYDIVNNYGDIVYSGVSSFKITEEVVCEKSLDNYKIIKSKIIDGMI